MRKKINNPYDNVMCMSLVNEFLLQIFLGSLSTGKFLTNEYISLNSE